MSDARKKFSYDIAIAHAGFIAGVFSGDLNPYSANPYRLEEVENLKTEEDKKADSKAGFNLLGQHLAMLAKKKKKF
jgi:hypothetical protein